MEDQDVKGSGGITSADPTVEEPGQAPSECEKAEKGGDGEKSMEEGSLTSGHLTNPGSQVGPQEVPHPSADGGKDGQAGNSVPAHEPAENVPLELKVPLCSSIVMPAPIEPSLPSQSHFMAMGFDEGNMSGVHVGDTCILPSAAQSKPTQVLETGSAEMAEAFLVESPSCTSEWVAMDCEGGPALSLLFENQIMRTEREELKQELRTISERVRASGTTWQNGGVGFLRSQGPGKKIRKLPGEQG